MTGSDRTTAELLADLQPGGVVTRHLVREIAGRLIELDSLLIDATTERDMAEVRLAEVTPIYTAVVSCKSGREAYSQGATVPLKAKAAGWDECLTHLREVAP